MLKKFLLVSSVFAAAFAILLISLLETSSISYVLATQTPLSAVLGVEAPRVDYQFPYAGSILPDSPFWYLKALRDRVWYFLTPSPLKKAELALLFSDKRLQAVQSLLEDRKPDIALSTLTKGEKYLEVATSEESIARAQSYDTSEFLKTLATAALKHREVIESLMPLVPEDGKPLAIKTEDYAKNAYKAARDALNSRGLPVPKDPFDGD